MRNSLKNLAALALGVTLPFAGGVAATLAAQTDTASTTTATAHRTSGNTARTIQPCREEDGSGQKAMCVWNDGTGDVIVNITRKNGKDDRTVVLINR